MIHQEESYVLFAFVSVCHVTSVIFDTEF